MRNKIEFYLGKQLGNLVVLSNAGRIDGRRWVKCKCLVCNREDYVAMLPNIINKPYKSCGCLQHIKGNRNPRWNGYGEISGAYFLKIKQSAEKRKIKFKITIKEIWDLFLKQNRKCAYSGIELTFPKELRDCTQTASLDRIDSNKGYEKGNLQWIHKNVNYMKIDFTEKDFLDFIKKIYDYKFK